MLHSLDYVPHNCFSVLCILYLYFEVADIWRGGGWAGVRVFLQFGVALQPGEVGEPVGGKKNKSENNK